MTSYFTAKFIKEFNSDSLGQQLYFGYFWYYYYNRFLQTLL